MAFLPVANYIDNLYATINGTYQQEVYPKGFVTLADMTTEMSRAISNDDIQNMKSCIYRNPPGTNPAIIWGDWTTYASEYGEVGSPNDSYILDDYFTNVGDVWMIHSHTYGDRLGFGFKLISDNGNLRGYHIVFRIAGTDHEMTGQTLSSGVDANGRKRDFCWGLMVNHDTAQALPFYLLSAYHSPLATGDNAQVYLPGLSGETLEYTINWMMPLFSEQVVPPEPSSDPYAQGGESEPSGEPTGDYDDTSDVISLPTIPGFNLAANSILNVYSPDTTDLSNLGNYLWSNFDLTDPTKTLSKVFTNPMDYILSLHVLPFKVDTGTAQTVTLGGFATTVSMKPITNQFVDIDSGSLDITEFWGNYLDFTYTNLTLCLPYVGQVQLDPDEVMGKTIKVKYRCDVITGAFVCFVYIDGDKVLGQYAGNCSMQVPISAADYSRLNAAVLGVAATAASGFVAALTRKGGGFQAGLDVAGSVVGNVQNAKMGVQHSGGLTGAPGFMGIQKPYLIIHRPRQSVPASYNSFGGYPSNVTMRLSDCLGFTSVRKIKLDGIPFTKDEIEELDGILKGGIYI